MTTRNFGTTNISMGQTRSEAPRPSMAASSGGAVKARQLVCHLAQNASILDSGASGSSDSLAMLTHADDSFEDTPSFAAGTAVCQPRRHRQPGSHDKRASRGYAGTGELARRDVHGGEQSTRRGSHQSRRGSEIVSSMWDYVLL